MNNQKELEEINVNDLSDKILTEEELLYTLGIKKSTLSKLRLKGDIIFCPITTSDRVYFADDILNYLRTKRTSLKQQEIIQGESVI